MKSKNKQSLTSYERAQKKVKDIKGFYGHLAVYVIVNLSLLFIKGNLSFFLVNSPDVMSDLGFLRWVNWNVYGTPIFWGIWLVIHWFKVFGKSPFLGKAWEERQIAKYMNKHKEY